MRVQNGRVLLRCHDCDWSAGTTPEGMHHANEAGHKVLESRVRWIYPGDRLDRGALHLVRDAYEVPSGETGKGPLEDPGQAAPLGPEPDGL